MPHIYTIVKKKSLAHASALASNTVNNDDIYPAGGEHVLIPSRRSISYGHNVSHAKNRTRRLRWPNIRTFHVLVGEVKKAIRLSNHDLRTYKKVTTVTE